MEDDLMHTMNMKNADGLTEPLSHQDMVLTITDYRAGMLHLQLGFGIRNAWSKNLPWLLMAIPHPNASRGVHWSKACIEAYERKPEAQHHRKSVLFLKPGTPLRSSIDLFISTGVMPPLLRLNTAPFLLIPLGDRMIEREHKYLSDVARPKTGVRLGHRFAIRRLRRIEEQMVCGTFRNMLVEQFLKVKQCKGAIKEMGLNGHPLFKYLLNFDQPWHDRGTKVTWALLERIIYRQELDIKYEHFPAAKGIAERDDAQRKKIMGRGAKSTPIPTSVDQLLLMNAKDHLASRGKDFGMITVSGEIQLEARSVESLLHGVGGLEGNAVSSVGNVGMDEVEQDRRELDEAAANIADVEQQIIAREDARDNARQRRYCFKILGGCPGRVRTMATFIPEGGGVLDQQDMAVTFHNEMHDVAPGGLAVDLTPRQLGANTRVMVMQSFNAGCSLETLVDSVVGWSAEPGATPEAIFQLPVSGVSAQDIHAAVRDLFEHHALEGTDNYQEADVQTEPWSTLLRNRFVTTLGEDPAKVQLTRSALRSLTTAVHFPYAVPLFRPRETLALGDMTAFELGMLLKESGWTWALMPRLKAQRVLLNHPTDQQTGVWYTTGKTIVPAYAECLLSSQRLLEKYGIMNIPHYAKRPVSDYRDLLQGKALKPLEAIEGPRARPMFQL